MTHQTESNPFDLMIQVLDKHGFEGLAHALEILFNEAMKIERSAVLGAQPYERTDERRGHANGFKPKRLATRVGRLNLQIPQTRGVEFYPQSLERGVRSERALKLAVAEMYVQGVSRAQSHQDHQRALRPGRLQHPSQPGGPVAR
jgi:transposase-like protein